MTELNVRIVDYPANPVRALWNAARTCTSKDFFASDYNHNDAAVLIKKIMDRGHLSVLEHVSITFHIKNISRAATHQLVRHRIASYSQASQRYIEEKQFEYIVPPSMADKSELFSGMMEEIQMFYDRLCEIVPKEDARYVLPNACCSNIVVTMNCRALLNFFNERLCAKAQWEIRSLAEQMLKLCREILPEVFTHRLAAPKCYVYNKCNEIVPCGRFHDLVG